MDKLLEDYKAYYRTRSKRYRPPHTPNKLESHTRKHKSFV
jgi:hypothetical protein